MCLTTKQKRPLIARKDIKVYKLVVKDSLNQKYTSLYQLFPYELNQVYEESENEENDEINSLLVYNKFGEGWFHSYREYAIAFCDKISLYSIFKNSLTILSCIIPKGTPYYIGVCDDICSKKIIITEECV